MVSCYILQFVSSYEIRRVRVPALFLSGLADQLIPPRMMTELYQVSSVFPYDLGILQIVLSVM